MFVHVVSSGRTVAPPAFDGQTLVFTTPVIDPFVVLNATIEKVSADPPMEVGQPTINNEDSFPVTTVVDYADQIELTFTAPVDNLDTFPATTTVELAFGIAHPTLSNAFTFPAGTTAVLLGGAPDLLVTQQAIEAIYLPVVGLRVTQVAAEVLYAPVAGMRVTQAAMELLRKFPPDPPDPVIPGDPPPPAGGMQEAWNPSDAASGFNVAYLQAIPNRTSPTTTTGATNKCVRAYNVIYGKRVWEYLIGSASPNTSMVGVGQNTAAGVLLTAALGNVMESIGYRSDGKVRQNAADLATYPSYTANDTVQVAFDETTRKIWFGKNGVYQGDPALGTGEAAIMPVGWYYPMDHVTDLPQVKLVSFDGLRYSVGPTQTHLPIAAPSGWSYFDPITD